MIIIEYSLGNFAILRYIIISLELIDIAEDAFSDAPNDYDKEIISDLRKMIQGNLKNDEYFEERLIKSDEEVAHYEELVAKVCAVRGENDRGVQNGYGILTSIYQNRLNLLSPFFHYRDSTSQK